MKYLASAAAALAFLSLYHAYGALKHSDMEFRIPSRTELAQHYNRTERALTAIGEGL